jgi:hypothetical protein
MKTLKFAPELCELIQTGKKTSTWRLFDDKNLRVGDTLRFLDTKTLLTFGTAVITDITVRTLGTIREEDWAMSGLNQWKQCTKYTDPTTARA